MRDYGIIIAAVNEPNRPAALYLAKAGRVYYSPQVLIVIPTAQLNNAPIKSQSLLKATEDTPHPKAQRKESATAISLFFIFTNLSLFVIIIITYFN